MAPRDKALRRDVHRPRAGGATGQPGAISELDVFRRRRGAAAWAAALRASEPGYADMGGEVIRVLAARPSDRNRDVAMEAQCQTIAAAILALTDPKAASQILRDLELRWGAAPRRARQDGGRELAAGLGLG